MSTYIAAQTVTQIIGNTFRIYGRNFWPVLTVFVLPFVPLLVALAILHPVHLPAWFFVGEMALAYLTLAPMTVLISDICLGNQPSVRRAYRRAFLLTPHAMAAVIFVLITTTAGFVLLIIPGVFMMLWSPLAATVAVLEDRPPGASLRRSIVLGQGHYWRNWSLIAFMTLLVLTAAVLESVVVALLVRVAPLPPYSLVVLGILLGLVAAPATSVATVLLYYDMRVRKEAYNEVSLAEDLRR